MIKASCLHNVYSNERRQESTTYSYMLYSKTQLIHNISFEKSNKQCIIQKYTKELYLYST